MKKPLTPANGSHFKTLQNSSKFTDFTDLLLAVESPYLGVAVLGIDVEGLILDVVVSFFEFPVNIMGFEYFANASFKYKGVIDTGNLLSFNDAFEFDTSVSKVTNHRKGVFFLHSLLS